MPASLYKPGEKDLTKLSRSNRTAPSEQLLRRGFAFLPGHAAERQANGGQPVHAGLRQGCINVCILYGRQHGVGRPAPAASPRAFRQKKNASEFLLKRFCSSRRLPIFTRRFQRTIFGTSELNFCVRNGNRWNLTVIDTDRSD